MIDGIRERTNGQVGIQISSFPELGLAGPDLLRLVADGALGTAEVYTGLERGVIDAAVTCRVCGVGGMEYIEFSPEINAALRKVAIEQVAPNWVKSVGGPDMDAVKMFNTYVAPILGVSIHSSGQAVEN